MCVFFFFRQKTAYEMRISDWSSDVCSSDLADRQGSGRGFSYLSSHGSLDQEHVGFFRDLVDGLGDAAGEQAIIDTARIVYRLYGDIFRGIDAGFVGVSHAD